MKLLPTIQPQPGAGSGAGLAEPPLAIEDIGAMQNEVRRLVTERKAVILAHNYQVPEVQDVADFVGDSLGLSRQAASTEAAFLYQARGLCMVCTDNRRRTR